MAIIDYYISNIKNKDLDRVYNNYNNHKLDLGDYILSYNNTIGNAQPSQNGINWGSRYGANTQNAYIQPTPEEVQRVLGAIHGVQRLPVDAQRQLIEATREVRYLLDGQIRARFGATRHFNAIRCLNNPESTQIAGLLRTNQPVQLAGEEFFGLNRFMANYADVADVQWWAVYENGSWRLDTWNPEGEHLDTGINGWGDLVGSVIKVNGHVMTPDEMIAFHRTLRLRNEMGFMGEDSRRTLEGMLRMLAAGESLPARFGEQLETAHDLGLINEDGRSLTYVGSSMLAQTTARQRKQRQLTETDPEVKRIIIPTILN